MEEFKVVLRHNSTVVGIDKVAAQRIVILPEFEAFVFLDTFQGQQLWNITHLETGMRMAHGETIDEAKEKIIKRQSEIPGVIERARKVLTAAGIALPLNV